MTNCPNDIASVGYVDSKDNDLSGQIQQLQNRVLQLENELNVKADIADLQVVKAEAFGYTDEMGGVLENAIKLAVATLTMAVGAQIAYIQGYLDILEGTLSGLSGLVQSAYNLAQSAHNLESRVGIVESLYDLLIGVLQGVNIRVNTAQNTADDANNLAQNNQSRLNGVDQILNNLGQLINQKYQESINYVNAQVTAINIAIELKYQQALEYINGQVITLNLSIAQVRADLTASINDWINWLDARLEALRYMLGEYLQITLQSIADLSFEIELTRNGINGLNQLIGALQGTLINHINNPDLHNAIDKIVEQITTVIQPVVYNYYSETVNTTRITEYIDRTITNEVRIEEVVDLSGINARLTRINADLIALTGISTGIAATQNTVVDFARTTATQTQQNNLVNAAASGTCQAMGGDCGNNFFQRLMGGFKNNLDAVFSGVDLLAFQHWRMTDWTSFYRSEWLGNFYQFFNQTLKPGFEHLYENMKNGIDRTLQLFNIAISLHNAAMLSANLGQTLSALVDSVMQNLNLGFKDPDGNILSFSQVFGAGVNQIMETVLGADLWLNTRVQFKKLSRVYQAGAQVAWSVISIVDTVKDTCETIVENTGKIGNALRASGAVLTDSYFRMPEQNDVQSATVSKIEQLNEVLRGVQEGAEILTEISENIIETRENLAELRDASEEFENSISNMQSDSNSQELTDIQNSTPPDISEIDIVPQISNET